jgi:putative phosphoribosyl transferase
MLEDREEAGRRLAARLLPFAAAHPVVLGLPRGGVPVAAVVATALDAPLEVLVVRKLGAPANPEQAIGAIAEAGVRVLDERAAERFPAAAVAAVEAAERAELERRVVVYRAGRPAPDLTGWAGLVLDDGLATGSSMRAACLAARALGAERVLAAVPVAPRHWERALTDAADETVAVLEPADFRAVGRFYRTFPQVSDAEVLAALAAVRRLGD